MESSRRFRGALGRRNPDGRRRGLVATAAPATSPAPDRRSDDDGLGEIFFYGRNVHHNCALGGVNIGLFVFKAMPPSFGIAQAQRLLS